MKMKLIFLFFALYFTQYTKAQKTKSFDVPSPNGNIMWLNQDRANSNAGQNMIVTLLQ